MGTVIWSSFRSLATHAAWRVSARGTQGFEPVYAFTGAVGYDCNFKPDTPLGQNRAFLGGSRNFASFHLFGFVGVPTPAGSLSGDARPDVDSGSAGISPQLPSPIRRRERRWLLLRVDRGGLRRGRI